MTNVKTMNAMTKNKEDRLIVLREYGSDVEAHIAMGVLQNNGVECVLNNEIMSSVYPLTMTSFGSIKLLVRSSDADIAEQILANTE